MKANFKEILEDIKALSKVEGPKMLKKISENPELIENGTCLDEIYEVIRIYLISNTDGLKTIPRSLMNKFTVYEQLELYRMAGHKITTIKDMWR